MPGSSWTAQPEPVEGLVFDRAELRQAELRRDVVPGHLDTHPDLYVLRIDADDVGVQAPTFVEVDDRKDVRDLVGERRVRRLIGNRERVDPALTRRLHPVERADAEAIGPRTCLARIEDVRPTKPTALEGQPVLLRSIPERLADLTRRRQRLLVFGPNSSHVSAPQFVW